MNYKTHIFALILFIGLFNNAFSQNNQNQPYAPGDSKGLFPIFKQKFQPQISIAPQVGYISFTDINSNGIAYGLEIALQCPLLCTKKNYIRQQLSFLYYNDNDFTYWNLRICSRTIIRGIK